MSDLFKVLVGLVVVSASFCIACILAYNEIIFVFFSTELGEMTVFLEVICKLLINVA